LTQAEKQEEAEVIKGISPIAWRHVNLIGRLEFQRPQNLINIKVQGLQTTKIEVI